LAFSSPSRVLSGSRLCCAPCRRASASEPLTCARPPWRAVARWTISAHRRRTNLDDDKAGTTTTARNRCSTPCAPVQATTECDFASTLGESRQFSPHSWIGHRWWYPLSQFKPFTPEPAVFTLVAPGLAPTSRQPIPTAVKSILGR
ncbi:Os11g0278900, partial [Oryza sativa Japonica Group]